MGPIGVPEMFAIFVIALVLFGPKKLPELGRTLGKALAEFRRAKNELKSTFETHMNELDRETRAKTLPASPVSTNSTPTYSGYSYPYEDYSHDSAHNDYSAPTQVSGTEELRAALPSSAGEIAPPIEHAEAADEALPTLPHVAGTIARNNGVRPLDESAEAPQSDYSHSTTEEHSV